MKPKVLIIGENLESRKNIFEFLENEEVDAQIVRGFDEALQFITINSVDLILIDTIILLEDEINACLKIKEVKNIPIILISESTKNLDYLVDFISKADDYLLKPFNQIELIDRVKIQIIKNEIKLKKNKNLIEIGDLEIFIDTQQVFIHSKEVILTPKEFEILKLLASNKGNVLSICKIYEEVWKEKFLKSDNTVMVHIKKIRDKIEQNSKHSIYIKTIRGVGYKI